MLRKFSNSRTLNDNIRLGALTGFVAGMVNVASFLIFFSFSSNVTGYYAILASEIVKGNWYQFLVVGAWIFLYFFGSFTSNFIIIHFDRKNRGLAHSIPILLEIICMVTVGFYGNSFYQETLTETEVLLSLMIFAMGLQNGLTASISNFAVKTTHLTGATTDLGILASMFTKKQFRQNPELVGKAKLILSIVVSFMTGAVISGFIYQAIMFKLFYVVSFFLVIVICYDMYKLKILRYFNAKKRKRRLSIAGLNDDSDREYAKNHNSREVETSVC